MNNTMTFMKIFAQLTAAAVCASYLSFTAMSLAADEPNISSAPIPLKKGALKLRTVEAVPGQKAESWPSIPKVELTVLDGESKTRSKTLWKATTDERGEAIWLEPIRANPNDPVSLGKKLFVRASRGGYESAARPIDPAAGEEIIALSKWAPWMVRAIDADTKKPIPTFTVMNRMLTNLTTHYGPTTARNGEALAGFFSEHTIRPRQLTIEAPGYKTFQIALTPKLGATNTYELKREPAAP